jgi:hypothetical protein
MPIRLFRSSSHSRHISLDARITTPALTRRRVSVKRAVRALNQRMITHATLSLRLPSTRPQPFHRGSPRRRTPAHSHRVQGNSPLDRTTGAHYRRAHRSVPSPASLASRVKPAGGCPNDFATFLVTRPKSKPLPVLRFLRTELLRLTTIRGDPGAPNPAQHGWVEDATKRFYRDEVRSREP